MTAAPQSFQPNIESLPERLRVNSCRLAHETADRAATRRIETEFAAADTIERLTERCEQYKGQVKAGSDEVDALKARVLELEGALRDCLEEGIFAEMPDCDCSSCAPIARARAALSPDGNRGEGK